MKTMIALRLAVSAILILGGARVVWAQATEFTGFGCVLDLSLIAGIPEPFAHLAPATTYTKKQCPSPPDQPMVILYAFATLEDWPGVTIDETDFTCLINGSQCGFNGSREATSQHLQIDQDGNAELRCSVDFAQQP
jgi:hypothetical protein